MWPQRKEKKTRAAGAGSSTCKPASIYHLNLMHVAPAIRRTANLMGAARMPGAPANGMILAPWGSFASTADSSIHTTHAARRAARQSSFARTANATTPQVYPLLRRSSSARSPPRPAWPSTRVARARARGREAGSAQDAADLRECVSDDGVGIDANVNHCEGAVEASGNGKISL